VRPTSRTISSARDGTIQTIGVRAALDGTKSDSVVVALKSRTAPVSEAVAQSIDALRWLQAHGARQIYFKYCSTFDSSAQGNIGPVTEALLDALSPAGDPGFTIATPAFPDNQRTVFKGHLFVGDVSAAAAAIEEDPLTPMTDPTSYACCRRNAGATSG
jgi:uncharacterized protein YgbK (DUF1537 family)